MRQLKLPMVSIGITTWNRATLVCRAIQSVVSQDYSGRLEIVVVDDGSMDGTDITVKNRFRDDPRVRYHKLPHRGIAAAKNAALTLATGDVRGLLDSDDFYDLGFIRECVAALLSDSTVGLVYTDNYETDGRGRISGCAHALDWSMEEFLRTCNLRGDCWLAWQNVLEMTDLHDERFQLEVDYDLFYKLAAVTEFKRVPKFLHYVSSHAGRTTRDRVKAAYWHAAGLGKHGHPIGHATARAQRCGKLQDWGAAIEEGYGFGKALREQDRARIAEAQTPLGTIPEALRG